MSKTQKFCNLHTFVKKENPGLYDLLEDMCAVGLFRPKYPTTFINPSKEVVSKLKDLVEKGDSDLAFEHLQKHFIYGKHNSLTGDLVNYNSKAVKGDLSKNTKKVEKISLWKSKDDNVAVFQQTNADFLEEGGDKARPKLDRKKKEKKGSAECDRLETTNSLFEKAASAGDNVMHVFARAVNHLLVLLEEEDSEQFKKVCSKLDPNPVLCWYLLVKPSSVSCDNCDNYISDDLFKKWCSWSDFFKKGYTSTLRKVFNSDEHDNSFMAKAKKARDSVDLVGFKQTRDSIISSYDGDMVTLLEDELRYTHSEKPASEFLANSVTVASLNNIDWSRPEESLVLLKDSSSILNSCLHKVMLDFVSSNAFHYAMIKASVVERLENNVVGAGEGAKKVVKILGKEGRKLIKSMEDADEEEELGKFVSSLTKKQLSSLKKILKSL